MISPQSQHSFTAPPRGLLASQRPRAVSSQLSQDELSSTHTQRTLYSLKFDSIGYQLRMAAIGFLVLGEDTVERLTGILAT